MGEQLEPFRGGEAVTIQHNRGGGFFGLPNSYASQGVARCVSGENREPQSAS